MPASGKPILGTLSRNAVDTVRMLHLFLPFSFDQFQHPELFLRDVPQCDCEPDVFRVQDAKTPADQSTVRRVHRLCEQVLQTPRFEDDLIPSAATRHDIDL